MKALVFLDDDRNFEDVTWVDYPEFFAVFTVRNYDDFVKLISSHKKIIDCYFSFDHDIACTGVFEVEVFGEKFNVEREATGLDCAKLIVGLVDKSKVFVHSKNPVGKLNIERLFNI
jgi:hypothetical protein